MRRGFDITTVVARVVTSGGGFALIGALAGPIGALIGAAIGLLVGAIHAWAIVIAKCYPAGAKGWFLMILDFTWSLPNTMLGSIYLALNLLFGNRLDKAQSRSRSSLVLKKGIFHGFATTLGPVEAGTTSGISRHEYVHVLQARIFGPFYVPLVIANYIVATVFPYWLIYHDHARKPIRSFGDYFMRGVYPHTWNEEWAYAVEGHAP